MLDRVVDPPDLAVGVGSPAPERTVDLGAALEPPPALTDVQVVVAPTCVGAATVTVSPVPRLPRWLPPQHHRVLGARIPRVCT